MTFFDFYNLMETTFSTFLQKEDYLIELVNHLLKDNTNNPLASKMPTVHKITNNSALLSLNDAKYINANSDTSKFEEYIQKQLNEDTSEDYTNSLCNALRSDFPDISYSNVAQYCAEAFLNSIKERIGRKETHTKEIDKICDDDIYAKISFVVSNLDNLSFDTNLTKLSYKPLNVSDKIKSDRPLYEKVHANVVEYYDYVDDLLHEKQNNSEFIFDAVSKKIKNRFIKNDEMPQADCFDYLVSWLQGETKGSKAACEIVISYFIQSCEVFYASSK